MKKNLKNIFVIEDDCIPYYTETNFVNRLCKIKKILDVKEDWDIFLGSMNTVFVHDVVEKINISETYFLKIKKGKTAHMICYNEKVQKLNKNNKECYKHLFNNSLQDSLAIARPLALL